MKANLMAYILKTTNSEVIELFESTKLSRKIYLIKIELFETDLTSIPFPR
jgi:hypothetical protein